MAKSGRSKWSTKLVVYVGALGATRHTFRTRNIIPCDLCEGYGLLLAAQISPDSRSRQRSIRAEAKKKRRVIWVLSVSQIDATYLRAGTYQLPYTTRHDMTLAIHT